METAAPAVTWPPVLRPALDALAPEDPAAAGRRVRNAAAVLAFAAWLLPEFRGLGTDTTAHRAAICAAFVATAVCAHFAARDRRVRAALAATSLAAGLLVLWFGRGAGWGLGFVAFAALVFALTEARRRFVVAPALPPESDPLPPLPGGPPAVLHTLAWLGISVLLTLHFAWQATVVPTGSMQPTIMGAAERAPTLQNLGSPGDHLLVERFSYVFRDPRRWDIVVFQYPLFRERLFVKRVVGLPGERVEIKDGDLWIDGKVARKPPLVQQTLWVELFPRASTLARPKAINDGFQHVDDSPGSWSRVSDTEMRCVPAKDAPSFASFAGAGAHPDLRVVFTATPAERGTVLARVTSRGVPVTLSLAAADASPGSSFDVDGRPIELPDVRATVGAPVRIEVCVADGEAWAVVDGRELARADVPPPTKDRRNRLEVGAQGGAVNFRDAWAGHDIEYVASGTAGKWDVPSDGFFFVGDNQEVQQGTPKSYDSRLWTVDVFHPAGGGAPIAAATEYPDENGAPVTGRIKTEKGRYVFLDVDGVPRDLPVEGTKRDRGVAWPFARRNHLVGRAFMIFWPFGTPDAGFRPRLLP
jgi:signal peptidase I